MELKKDNKVPLGVITSPHGVKGNFKVKSFTEKPSSIINYKPLYILDKKIINLKLEKMVKNLLICSSEEIRTREEAKLLVNNQLYIFRSSLPKSKNMYHTDVIGMEVRTLENNFLGTVQAIHDFGAGEIIEVKPDTKSNTIMLPFYSPYLIKVDKILNIINIKYFEN